MGHKKVGKRDGKWVFGPMALRANKKRLEKLEGDDLTSGAAREAAEKHGFNLGLNELAPPAASGGARFAVDWKAALREYERAFEAHKDYPSAMADALVKILGCRRSNDDGYHFSDMSECIRLHAIPASEAISGSRGVALNRVTFSLRLGPLTVQLG